MGKHHLRKDNICQNCGHTVPERFCTFCGQENIETRQSFGHLLRHFIEDLTHYEGNFWRTIKHLLFRPGYLTKTYLAGKRSSYVLPVKLYIFISFIAFFIPAFTPHYNDEAEIAASKELYDATHKAEAENKPDTIRLTDHGNVAVRFGSNDTLRNGRRRFETEKEYESFQRSLPEAKRDGFITRYMAKTDINLRRMDRDEIREELTESFSHNFPKVLFIFLPVFAFTIWIFHGKKRWLFFDHAIFTLHYFSFILLLFTIVNVFTNFIPWYLLVNPLSVSTVSLMILWLWGIYYFYRAHRKMYEESRSISVLKATLILFVNSMLFLMIMLLFLFYSVNHIH